jgi:putative tryptophan/tyrosine transport system substrate-binding protein
MSLLKMKNNRRRFVIAIGASALVPVLSHGQSKNPGKVARIGILVPANRELFSNRFASFQSRLRELGYIEGKNVVYEYRYADGKLDRLPDLARELIAAKVDLIFSAGAESVLAAMNATTTIPILFGTVQDPLASGIVRSLSKPGANATGMSALGPDLSRKRLQLLKDIAPGIARVGFLWSPVASGSNFQLHDMQAASAAVGLQLQSLEVRDAKDLELAFQSILKDQLRGLVTNPDPLINAERTRIVDFAAKNRLTAVYAAPEFSEAGGLMAYGPSYNDLWRRSANYADKILKGAKPADLPVQLPTKFELTINMKTARAIGITIPNSILVRAEKVIE